MSFIDDFSDFSCTLKFSEFYARSLPRSLRNQKINTSFKIAKSFMIHIYNSKVSEIYAIS